MARRIVVSDLDDVADVCSKLRIVTLVLDVEPMIARWGTSLQVLSGSIAATSERLFDAVGTLRSLVFVTNSARRLPESAPPRVLLRGRAHKPWQTSWARDLNRPVAVVGDMVLTDGLLAVRLGAAFLHYPLQPGTPRWPRWQALLGVPLVRLLFTDLGGPDDDHQ
jgi:hypothetical protein